MGKIFYEVADKQGTTPNCRSQSPQGVCTEES